MRDLALNTDPHRASMERFLQAEIDPTKRADVGLQGMLRAHFPLRSEDQTASLEFIGYALHAPRFDADECERRAMTFAAPLKVTVRLMLWEKEAPRQIRDVKEQEVFFGEVPMLNARGAFVFNGVERAPIMRLCRAPGGGHRLRAAGGNLEDYGGMGMVAMLEKARAWIQRAEARGALDALMPSDVISAKSLSRAWYAMLRMSRLFVDVDATNPAARVAQAWRVNVDLDARDALDEGPFARWLTRHEGDPFLADLAPDAPVNALGGIDHSDPEGDRRTLAARIAPTAEGAENILRALVLTSPEAPRARGALDRAVAERSGALVVAPRAGRVHLANDQRVWLLDGAETPTMIALRPLGAPRIATALTLRPVVRAGQEVQAGDPIAEGAAVADATLALGRRCTVAGASDLAPGRCRVSARMREAFRSARVERAEATARDTKLGKQFITPEVPTEAYSLRHLDASGVAALGAEVEPGDVLAGLVTPLERVQNEAGAWEEPVADSALRATVRARVVGVEISLRRGVERSARHASMVDAMRKDLRDEAEERTACLAALRGVSADACRIEARKDVYWREAELDRGEDMPPGVITSVTFELLVERELACGDVLANGQGARWTVDAIVDDAIADVEIAGEGGEMYLMKLAPPAPPAKKKRAARKRVAAKG